ncbi:Maf family protein [Rickettsiales bacterium LUAb2]
MQKLILASSSKARFNLLQQINITPDLVVASDIDETPNKHEKAFALVKRLSNSKALAIKQKYTSDYYILAADTVVCCGSKILGKPKDINEQEKFLNLLSGKKHKVITGLCVITPENITRIKVVSTAVKFKHLSKSEINHYLQSNQWQGKSGGYSIQGLAEIFIEQIIGSYSNIVGLPLSTTYKLLSGLGYKTL